MAKVIPIQNGRVARSLRDAGAARAADGCPEDPEDTAEQYLLRSLTPGETECFEEHYMACESCAEVLTAAEDYISSMRVAGLRLARNGLHRVQARWLVTRPPAGL